MAEVSFVKLYSNECQMDPTDGKSTLVKVMAWRLRQQAITWANVDPNLCHHMASLGNNELNDDEHKNGGVFYTPTILSGFSRLSTIWIITADILGRQKYSKQSSLTCKENCNDAWYISDLALACLPVQYWYGVTEYISVSNSVDIAKRNTDWKIDNVVLWSLHLFGQACDAWYGVIASRN